MKNLKWMMCFAIAIVILSIPGFCKADEPATCTGIDSAEKLVQALSDASCSTITLGGKVELKTPIEITKVVTIDGKGFTISADTSFSNSGDNGTLITAKGSSANVTLKNLTLSGAKKYGAQAYDGGKLTLDGVRIEDCKFGGVLANGGTVTIKNLDLGHNGESANNGIEISKGSTLSNSENNPEVVMDGILTSDEPDGVVNVATNDNNLKEYSVKNTESTENKLYVEKTGVVVTDENNTVVYEGNGQVKAGINGKQLTSTGQPAAATHKVVITYSENSSTIIVEDGKTLASISDKLNSIKNAFEGMEFVNFTNEAGEVYDESTPITSDITLTANFKEIVVQPETPNTPQTFDGITAVAILGLISAIGIAFSASYLKKSN